MTNLKTPYALPRSLPFFAEQKAFEEWLACFEFDRFVTLATNNVLLSTNRARELLRSWDAWQNSKVAGGRWQRQPERRMFGFYFLEKVNRNPHWHGLIRFRSPDPTKVHQQADRFDQHIEEHWLRLIPSGSIANVPVTCQAGARKYVVKGLWELKSFEEFIMPDQFS